MTPYASRTLLVGSCLAVMAALACGGGSPAAPSGSSAPGGSSNTGATIAGLVNGANASAAAAAGLSTSSAAVSGLTVSIVGTNLSASVDGSGYFEIPHVPAGDVELHFQGGGVDATVRLTGVDGSQLIEIVVNVSGSSLTVVGESRTDSKVSICHRTAAGAWNLISVGPTAEPAHRAHGDARPGEPVPGQETMTFGEQCQVTGASVRIEKSTNGKDADSAPGPRVAVGSAVNWTYFVTNTGTEQLSGVAVSDDKGVAVACPQTTLAAGQSMTCTGSGVAVAGQYVNVGTVTATWATGQVTDSDASHYYGETDDGGTDEPKVEICHKTGNGEYHLIEIAVSAEPAHRKHGDGMIGEPVPGQDGKVFGPSCTVQ